jgi:hypothetical protein
MKVKSILFAALALLAGGSVSAQLTTTVATGGQKYVLLEEGTGTWCGWCPDGAQVIEEIIEPSYPRAVIASFHNGDVMTLSGDPYNGAFISGFPGGTIDRIAYGTGTKPCNVSRSSWVSKISSQSALAPKFDVMLTVVYDTTTRTAIIKVLGTTLVGGPGGWNINAYIVEDSVTAATGTYVQHSYLYPTSTSWFYNQCTTTCGSGCASCANLPDSIYRHMNVVRKVLAPAGIYGDVAFTNPTVGDTASMIYSYTVPTTSRARFIKVIGLVQSYSVGSTPDSRPIENVVSVHVPLPCAPVGTTAITVVPAMTTATVKFPYSTNYNFAGPKGYRYATTTTSTAPTGLGTFTNTPTVNLTGLTAGTTYYVWVRDSCDGALTGWTSKSFVTKTVNVADAYAENFTVSAFPSPVQNTLNIAIDGAIGNDAKIQLLDLSGRVIKTAEVNASKLELNMQELAAGMYLLKYTDNIHNQTIKITKE